MADRRNTEPAGEAEVVQLDDVMLEACGPALRTQLMTEAAMLAEAFAPEGRTEQLLAIATTLASGARDDEMDRDRARQLACALRCLARGVEA
ncbi:hypothetical protein [Phenylobacterium sp.]|uniref:hypothetical protein n=1 Tax=Phenylobacterium sp. TaxID=1871053 RepID=UPI002C1914B6|nr:hypothetical protein [Phenylobacterium sp.]HLZ77365.1 hypothetical protein [Phenylobacterium sp.]